MTKLNKDQITAICSELKQAADANNMRLVHETHAKLANALENPEAEDAPPNGKETAKGKAETRARA